MEVPIPNFYFMGVQFIHLLAISLWVGGIVMVGMIVAPTLFRKIKSRQAAGDLLGEILWKFDLLTLFCIGALVVTSAIKYWTWENLTPWNLTRYVAIALMSALGLYSALVVSPKLRGWMAFQASKKEGGAASAPASTIDFDRLHHTSVRLMKINLICGIVVLLMA